MRTEQYTYCQTCGARDDAEKRGLEIDVPALIAERDALRARVVALEDALDWFADENGDGPQRDAYTLLGAKP